MGVRKSVHVTKMQVICSTRHDTTKYNKHRATPFTKCTDLKFEITHNVFRLAITTIFPNRPLCL